MYKERNLNLKITKLSRIAFIPVRGGSKSIPQKNIKPFCGKPLVYWTLKAACECKGIDYVIVGTDDQDIKDIVNSFEFNNLSVFNRSQENAQDTSTTESVLLEFINASSYEEKDDIILIQATSPLLRSEDLSGALELYNSQDVDSVLSCSIFKRFLWSYSGLPINYDFNERPRRQDFKGDLIENGAFYISNIGRILSSSNRLSGKIKPYIMPEYTSFEIDEPDDWTISESLMRKYNFDLLKFNNKIKLVVSDVDGVLTDLGMYYSEFGDELKKFNTRDGMAFELLRERNIYTGIITSENTEIVSRRSLKIKSDFLVQSAKFNGKLNACLELCSKIGCSISEVAYIGDDLNCIDLLSNVGFAACPNNAVEEVKQIPNIHICSKKGGDGVFREFIEVLQGENYI